LPELAGRSVIVTGGAGGLGRACVLECLSRGARVTIGDVDDAAGHELARGAPQGRAAFVACDVSRNADVERLVATAVRHGGGLHGLVNNAGIEGNGSVESCDEETFDRVLAVNLKGMFLCSKHALPELRRAGGGAIVNMASVAGFWGEPGTAAYNAAKGGVIGLTRAMAMDHGRDGIRVNCVCPGYHATGMPERFFADQADPAAMRASVDELIALRRMGRPEELARTVAFLLSDDNPYITGAALVLDGGMTAGFPWHGAAGPDAGA
jgi:NAD(P)-dependent dehydrogenase (short-subunit alcohol dehydrogenase family)